MVIFMENRKFNWGLFWKLLISLVLFWLLLAGEANVYNLLLGGLVSVFIMVIFALSYEEEDDVKTKLKLFNIMRFSILVFYNIYKASVLYIKRVFANQGAPEVVNIDLGIKQNIVAVLIANAITLTPGTITLKIFDDYRLKVLMQIDGDEDIESFKMEIDAYKKALGNK